MILFPFVRKYQYCLALSLARCQIPHNKILLMKTLKPKSYIKSTEQSEEYQCSICNYVAEKPQRCNGPCKKIFCMQCVKCIKSIKNECPYKCSKPFELTSEKEVDLQYRCPFQPDQCKEVIKSLSDFFAHGDRCQYLPEGWKDKEENYSKYRCEKGHDLFYLGQEGLRILYRGSFYEKVMNSYCCCCKEQGYCRSVCPQCSTKENLVLFCTSCRKPPCTKDTCLYEHRLRKIPHYDSRSKMCDFCGTAVYLYGPYAYEDRECNFDVCESCFANLPEKHEQVPFKMSVQAIGHLDYYSQEQRNQDRGIRFVMESDSDSHENPMIIDIQREEEIVPIEIDERQIAISVGSEMPHKEKIDRQIVIAMPTLTHNEEEQPDYHRIQKQKQDKSWLTRFRYCLCCCFKETTVSSVE